MSHKERNIYTQVYYHHFSIDSGLNCPTNSLMLSMADLSIHIGFAIQDLRLMQRIQAVLIKRSNFKTVSIQRNLQHSNQISVEKTCQILKHCFATERRTLSQLLMVLTRGMRHALKEEMLLTGECLKLSHQVKRRGTPRHKVHP